MSTETTNLQLVKPTEDDFYDINLINGNMDKIDAAVAAKETPAGAQAKIDEHINTADPHAEYIKKSLATAVNDFILASAPGVFVKKTLAEIKTILGLGSAAYTASTAYATAAQGTKADNAATQASLNTHIADYVRQPGYGTTAGSANTYTLTLSPALVAYAAGVGVTVKVNVANTGASTINVNGLGAKSILDSKGNAMTVGKLRLNGVYSLRYDGTNFILQGEGGEYGTPPTAAQVLDGIFFGTEEGLVEGIMPNRAGDTPATAITKSNTTLKLRASVGYRDGVDDYVTYDDPDWTEANILLGKNIFGTVGTLTLGYKSGDKIHMHMFNTEGLIPPILSVATGTYFSSGSIIRDLGFSTQFIWTSDANSLSRYDKTTLLRTHNITSSSVQGQYTYGQIKPNYLFLTNDPCALRIYSTSFSSVGMVQLETTSAYQINSVCTDGISKAYCTVTNGKLYVVDFSSTSSPTKGSWVAVPIGSDVAYYNGLIYVSDNTNGMTIYNTSLVKQTLASSSLKLRNLFVHDGFIYGNMVTTNAITKVNPITLAVVTTYDVTMNFPLPLKNGWFMEQSGGKVYDENFVLLYDVNASKWKSLSRIYFDGDSTDPDFFWGCDETQNYGYMAKRALKLTLV
jgi:hypothetical protein